MDLSIVATGAAICALLALSGFFSGSETALTAINRATMHQLAGRGSSGAAVALKLTEDNERLIGSILLGNNLVNVLATALATALFTALLGEAGVAYATLMMTLLVTIFAEVAPKTYAITNPDKASVRVAPLIAVVVRVFAPVVGTISWLVQGAFRILGIQVDPDAHALAPYDQIRGTIALHHQEGGMEREERDRLLAALELRERDVASVMRHRRDIQSISADEPPEEIVNFCLSSPHTRIPLWRGEPENIVGVLHAKDLLRVVAKQITEAEDVAAAIARLDVMAVAMKPWFVPDTRPLDDQLRAFLKRRSHFALVVDEYGVLQGLLTLEDIIEEIVGEISDEHDVEAEGVVREASGALVVPGTMSIRSLNRACDWDLPDDEAATVAGLVIHESQTIPTEGQVFVFHGLRFEVVERECQQITRLRVRELARPAKTDQAGETGGERDRETGEAP
jgi:Mg2+/Co2+ transporter CorB